MIHYMFIIGGQTSMFTNYEEAILLENWNKNARECWALSNTPKDVQLPPQPRVHGIRFIDYFCGNKDWIVQLGPI